MADVWRHSYSAGIQPVTSRDISVSRITIMNGRFGSKVGQIGPKWDKSGTFSDQISVHLARSSQMYWNLIWKSPGFVPFWANLTHFGAKSTIPDTQRTVLLSGNRFSFRYSQMKPRDMLVTCLNQSRVKMSSRVIYEITCSSAVTSSYLIGSPRARSRGVELGSKVGHIGPKRGKIRDFWRSYFSTFWLTIQSWIYPIWSQTWNPWLGVSRSRGLIILLKQRSTKVNIGPIY